MEGQVQSWVALLSNNIIVFGDFLFTVADMDYVAKTSTKLTFTPCEMAKCTEVRLMDDCVVEDKEKFNIVLTPVPGLDRRIKIHEGDGEIIITDDDGMIHVNLCVTVYHSAMVA